MSMPKECPDEITVEVTFKRVDATYILWEQIGDGSYGNERVRIGTGLPVPNPIIKVGEKFDAQSYTTSLKELGLLIAMALDGMAFDGEK